MPDEEKQDKKIDFNIKKLNPLFRSGILLKGAAVSFESDDNGILTSYEVINKDMFKTELAVLSACETGLGEIKNGEGVYGLKRAFLAAGAKNVIISLWKVNDDATQKLMSSFYGYLMQNHSIDESLKLAQLELKKEFPKPYFWGAFIKVGR